jgi:hypothetical protein
VDFVIGRIHIELIEHMTGWQEHLTQLDRIPRIDDDAATGRIVSDLIDSYRQLIDS